MARQFALPPKGAALLGELLHSSDLIGLWPGNERSGALLDRSRYRLNAAASGSPTYGAVPTGYSLGYPVKLDGLSSFSAGAQATHRIDRGDAFSALAVAYPTILQDSYILQRFLTYGWRWKLQSTGEMQLAITDSSANVASRTTTGTLTANTLVTLGFSVATALHANNITLYKNGSVEATTLTSTALLVPDIYNALSTLEIGTSFVGSLAFIALWKRSLEDWEHKQYSYLAGLLS
jgi:hypothetical protein